MVEGLKAAFAPVGELFTPLKPVFDWLGEKLQAAWQWFKNLIAPVKATQDTLPPPELKPPRMAALVIFRRPALMQAIRLISRLRHRLAALM